MKSCAEPPLPELIISATDTPIILVGNGACDKMILKKYAQAGPLVAVDGGYYACRQAGLVPDLLIGDLDSVNLADMGNVPAKMKIHRLSEQDTTDLEKAFCHLQAPYFIGFGFLGKRLDHTLAALTVLARYALSHKMILVGSDDVVHVTQGCFSLSLTKGQRVSIWPLSKIKFATSQGLVWPIDGLEMAPDQLVGTSNQANADHISLVPAMPNEGSYAVLVDLSHLDKMTEQVMKTNPNSSAAVG